MNLAKKPPLPIPQTQFSFSRFKLLAQSHWPIIAIIASIIATANTFQALTDVPLYVSTSKLQVQAFEASRTIDDKSQISNEIINDGMRLNNAVLVFQSKIFLNELAKELQSSPDRNKIVMSWGIGRKLKMSYALYRLGLASIQYQRIDMNQLSTEELGGLLSSMIRVTPIPADQTIEIKVSALEDWTAYAINQAVLSAFVRSNKILDQDEFNRSIDFLSTQVDAAKSKLDLAEEQLAVYLKDHINVSSENSTSAYLTEYLALRNKKKELENNIYSDQQLLANLKSKLKAEDGQKENIGEVLEALKQELLELKYQKAKLMEQGYPNNNPGVIALDRKIENAQDFIQRSEKGTVNERDILGAGEYRKAIANKIFQTQETLLKSEAEIKGLNEHLRSMDADVSNLPEDGMTASALKREVARAAELHGELEKRLEMMNVRSQAARNTLRVVTSPNEMNAPMEIPFLPRVIFGLLAGILFGLSTVLLMDLLSPRIANRSDIEASGFSYAGRFYGTLDSCTEILAAMQCIFKKREPDEPIPTVLCCSASPAHTIHTFLPLIDFMASRNEKVLLITEDETLVPDDYQSHKNIEGVKTYSYPNGKKDLIQIQGAQSFGVIQILLEEFATSYSAIFLFVAKGSESSAYSLCRNLADRILMVGEEGTHTLEAYRKLSAGFEHKNQVYMALLPYSNAPLKKIKKRINQIMRKSSSHQDLAS